MVSATAWVSPEASTRSRRISLLVFNLVFMNTMLPTPVRPHNAVSDEVLLKKCLTWPPGLAACASNPFARKRSLTRKPTDQASTSQPAQSTRVCPAQIRSHAHFDLASGLRMPPAPLCCFAKFFELLLLLRRLPHQCAKTEAVSVHRIARSFLCHLSQEHPANGLEQTRFTR